MKHVRLSEARANIAALIDEVERGGTITIEPDQKLGLEDHRLEDGRQAMRELRELRKGAGKVTVEEVLAWRDEGRRF